ncbi:MAG: hypothetical protein E6R04_09230 [Spirochaetes bacterium]|jgi:hypothetical protein|nr:MAG: hypothetical protein E6R04_09230 [Spirochaetota bacterium]
MSEEKPFRMVWKKQVLRTTREWFAAALKCESKEEAEQFQKMFIKEANVPEQAFKDTIGYMTGYCDQATLDKAIELFGAEHPVFGKTLPGPDRAFAIGVEMGLKLREGKKS